MRNFLVAAVLVLFANVAQANLVVTLQEVSGGNVEISWSSNMTVISDTDGGPSQLHFDDLSGSPFSVDAGIAGGGGTEFILSSDLTLSGTDISDGGAPYTKSYGRLTLISNNMGSKDLRLEGAGAASVIETGDTYALSSGSAIVNGLNFSDLNVGTYSSTMGDSGVFGSMTLVVSAVPEPSAFLFGTVVCLAASLRRKR